MQKLHDHEIEWLKKLYVELSPPEKMEALNEFLSVLDDKEKISVIDNLVKTISSISWGSKCLYKIMLWGAGIAGSILAFRQLAKELLK